MLRIAGLSLLLSLTGPAVAAVHEGTDEFLARAAEKYGLTAEELAPLLDAATFQPSIVAAMRRPAEGKAWHEYRPIFLTDERIEGGVEFWRENEEIIDAASREFGVEPQIIVSIIGVETFYGRITGSYRVLDALTTLGFYYPTDTGRDRSGFFSDELMQFVLLSREEDLPATEVTGSYAGAMGLGQFIPSSYRAYAVDFDDDGSRDLWRSRADAIGSVANYLRVHGWAPGGPVAIPTEAGPDADMGRVSDSDFLPRVSLGEFEDAGFAGVDDLDPATQAALLALEHEDGDRHWYTFNNFYVITRYNRSPKYAMAVYQLAEAIKAEKSAS